MSRVILKKSAAVAALLACMLTACQTTTEIHLFSQGMPAEDVPRVTRELQSGGYRVRMSHVAPPALYGPTIIYHPASRMAEEVTAIQQILGGLGYDKLELVPVHAGNHTFTPNNLGVYLGKDISEDVADPLADYMHEFTGICDQADAYLELQDGGQFRAVHEPWDGSAGSEIFGAWILDELRLQLLTIDAELNFTVEKSSRTSQYGHHKTVRLVNETRNGTLWECNFHLTLFTDL